MNRERLEHLITILKVVANSKEKQFDMSFWSNTVEPTCGTSACAMGWAAMHPEFRRQGLGLQLWTAGGADDVEYIPTLTMPDGRILYDYQAAALFFDITETDAARLFSPFEYRMEQEDIKPSHVIDRIRELLDD